MTVDVLGIKWQSAPIGSHPPQAQPKEGETLFSKAREGLKGARASGGRAAQLYSCRYRCLVRPSGKPKGTKAKDPGNGTEKR